MSREEEQNLKMELIDTISEERNSMDILGMKEEVETIFDYFKEAAISEIAEANTMFIKTSFNSAIYSYKLYPNMELNNRILFINGANFAFYVLSDDDSKFNSLSLDEKITYALEEFVKFKDEEEIESDDKYTELGITSLIRSLCSNNKKAK